METNGQFVYARSELLASYVYRPSVVATAAVSSSVHRAAAMSDGSDAEVVVAPVAKSTGVADDIKVEVSPDKCQAVADDSDAVADANVGPNERPEVTNSAAKSQLSSRASAFSIAALMAKTREDDITDGVVHVKDVDDVSDVNDDDDDDDVFAEDDDDDNDDGDDDKAKILRNSLNAATVPLGE